MAVDRLTHLRVRHRPAPRRRSAAAPGPAGAAWRSAGPARRARRWRRRSATACRATSPPSAATPPAAAAPSAASPSDEGQGQRLTRGEHRCDEQPPTPGRHAANGRPSTSLFHRFHAIDRLRSTRAQVRARTLALQRAPPQVADERRETGLDLTRDLARSAAWSSPAGGRSSYGSHGRRAKRPAAQDELDRDPDRREHADDEDRHAQCERARCTIVPPPAGTCAPACFAYRQEEPRCGSRLGGRCCADRPVGRCSPSGRPAVSRTRLPPWRRSVPRSRRRVRSASRRGRTPASCASRSRLFRWL